MFFKEMYQALHGYCLDQFKELLTPKSGSFSPISPSSPRRIQDAKGGGVEGGCGFAFTNLPWGSFAQISLGQLIGSEKHQVDDG